MDDMLTKALGATRESKAVEFKQAFDVNSQGDWYEVIKDIIALANSGGGVILFGVLNSGCPSGLDVAGVLSLDPADIANKITKYTGYDFSEFEISEQWKGPQRIAALAVMGVSIPIVFARPGTYDIGGGKQKCAFSAGQVYFRHGAKSEPGTTDDLRRAFDRSMTALRKEWLRGVKKVVAAPIGSRLIVPGQEVRESPSELASPIRLVDDPKAPAYRKIDPDITHPYRGKEFLKMLNDRFGGTVKITSHDLLCLRRLYHLEENPGFCHKPKFYAIQYSESLADWIVEQYARDEDFFEKARHVCYERRFEFRLVGQRTTK